LSPYNYNSGARVFAVNSNGYLHWAYVTYTNGVRPVINLKSTTKFINNGTGDPGTSTNPYEVVVS